MCADPPTVPLLSPSLPPTLPAGSSHQVALTDLVPAEKVVKEKRRQARQARLGGGATQQHPGGGGGDDVIDV